MPIQEVVSIYFIAGFRVIIYVPTAFFQVLRHPQEAQ